MATREKWSPTASRPATYPRRVPAYIYLLIPMVALYLLLFIVPLLIMVGTSFELYSGGAVTSTLTLANYVQFFTEFTFQNDLYQTLYLGITVTLTALLLAYPLAYVMAKSKSGFVRGAISAIVVLPLFVSLVARTFGWIILLSDKGIINYLLVGSGLVSAPVPLIFNFVGVYISMVHILIPFMVFSIYSSLGSLDENLVTASRSLGASSYQAFRRVVLPLSMPGVTAGSVITFVLTISAYVTPALLGAGRVPSLPVAIYNYAVLYLNTPLASAFAVILLLITAVSLSVYLRVVNVEGLYGGEARE